MNCQNCAAPLEWTPGIEVLKCGFCGSHRSVSAAAEFVDRLVLLQKPAESACPACRSEMEQVSVDRMPGAVCPTCRGLLLSCAVFAALVRERRADYRGAERAPSPLTPEKLLGQVNCPQCMRSMERHPYGGPGSQVIDCCSRCELVWLDCGELAAIEAAPGRRSSQR
ncbi:MAG: zf-TFIIB domain-containing protein [Planctomycetaceae bacterium]|nr:zf-TFIIB domain-containing protein [Planctomycetaceae bacterium]